MDKLKRFVPVIALALVLILAVGQPMQVFAAVEISFDESTSIIENYDGYDLTTYPTNYCEHKVFYVPTSGSSVVLSSGPGDEALGTYNLPASFYNFIFNGTSKLSSSSDSWEYYNLRSIMAKSNYIDSYFNYSFTVYSDVDLSCNVYYYVQTFQESGYTFTQASTESAFINSAFRTQTFTFSYPASEWFRYPATEYGFAPYMSIRFYDVPADATILVSDVSFSYSVKTAAVVVAPTILSQNWTASPKYYTPGSSASSLKVDVTYGAGEVGTVTYQWYKSSTGSSSDGVAISGATSSSYTPPTSSKGTMYYYCVVTNTYEGKTATTSSSMACIKVVDAPKAPQITQNLSSGTMEYTQGDTAAPFVISAINSGDGSLTYQWYRNTTNSTSGGTAISGATKSSYTPSTATVGTQYYYCVVTNSVGTLSESVTSNVGAVRVVPPPDPAQAPVINPNLSTITKEYYIGSPAAELKIGASVTDGGTLTYQWYSNTVNSSSGGTLLPGETDRTFTPPTDTLGTMYYYCVVTNTLPDSKATSTSYVAPIRVVELPKASAPVISTDLPQDPIVYTQGDAASAIGISARSPDGGVLTYQWYKNVVAENTGGAAIAGADGPSYEPATSEVGTAYYYVVITNSLNDTTASVTSRVATVVVEQDMVPDLIGDVIDGITNLPQAIMDGIVGLFVPTEADMIAYQEKWDGLLSSRFGVLYQASSILHDVFSSLNADMAAGSVNVPEVTVDLAGVPFTFGGWQVDVIPDGFEFLADASKVATSMVATLAFFGGARRKFEHILVVG